MLQKAGVRTKLCLPNCNLRSSSVLLLMFTSSAPGLSENLVKEFVLARIYNFIENFIGCYILVKMFSFSFGRKLCHYLDIRLIFFYC